MARLEHLGYWAYQAFMRLASYALDFSPPELLEGPGSVRRLTALIKAKGLSKVLVVTDKGLMGARLLEGLFAGFAAEGLAYVLYHGVQANPTIPNIEEALALYRQGG
jgi:alcohol dehydrogenase